MKSILIKSLNIGFKAFITTSHLIQSQGSEGVKTSYPGLCQNYNIDIKKETGSKIVDKKYSNSSEGMHIKNQDLEIHEKIISQQGNENKEKKEENKIEDINALNIQENSMANLTKSDKILFKNNFKSVESKIPASSFSRAWNFGLLGISMISSAIPGTIKSRLIQDDKTFKDYLISENNSDKLSRTLCKMRGAALKFGQLLSTFEDVVIPEPLRTALEKARQDANSMPKKQFLNVMSSELGEDWEKKFASFDKEPFAAASIGQVHYAEVNLKKLNNENNFHSNEINSNIKVAVKVQYPGVTKSIDSDLNNLKAVFKYLNLIPKGLYIDNLVKNLGAEIKEECDYILEAERQKHYYTLINTYNEFMGVFKVPRVISALSTKNVLTSEFIEGENVDEMEKESQEVRDFVGEMLLKLCLTEIFIFKFMQTDPNPANFFVHKINENKKLSKDNLTIGLIDFGAARGYGDKFVDTYLKIVHNGSYRNKDEVIKYSKDLGFLTGMESQIMLDAHANSVFAIAEPFANFDESEYFDFGNQNVTKRIYKELPVMLKHRLTSPPTEIYSLHRRLSGVYLTCIKLKSKVKSKLLFKNVVEKYSKLNNLAM